MCSALTKIACQSSYFDKWILCAVLPLRQLAINLCHMHTPHVSQGIHRLSDPIYEPPEAQLSKRHRIPALQLSQWNDIRVLMVTISKETWREIKQG